MARIAVLGGTGYVGSALVKEARSRNHEVTSVSRKDPPARSDGVRYVVGSALDDDVLTRAVAEQDVVIEAVSPRGDMAGREEGLVARLIDVLTPTGTRLGVIGGASSLLVAPGGPRLFDVSEIAPETRPEIETGLALLQMLKDSPDALDWFYV